MLKQEARSLLRERGNVIGNLNRTFGGDNLNRPLLRAEGIILHNSRVLVQSDDEESFYRFPGGSIDFGETASKALKREFIEEFDLEVKVTYLAVINESIVEYDGKKRHFCTLIHRCSLIEDEIINFESIRHKELENIKLSWKTISQLEEKPLYPKGILDILKDDLKDVVHHLVTFDIR